jgi:hypothetical protein
MKRFLLFTFDTYYPSGGWSDFKGSFDTEAEALHAYNNPSEDKYGYAHNEQWFHIVDGDTGQVVTNDTNYDE